MKTFLYHDPKTIAEALELLHYYGADASPLAGGTDLLLDFKNRKEPPKHIISLMGIEDLQVIRDKDNLQIGTTATLSKIEKSHLIKSKWKMLAEGASVIGSRQIRNQATIGGNICNALPCADTAPPLYAACAGVVIANHTNGQRVISIDHLVKGPRRTVLVEDELVIGFTVPYPPINTGSVYLKHTIRNALDMSIVSIAVSITLNPDDECIRTARIAPGNSAPVVYRAVEAETALMGERLSVKLMKEVAELVVKSSTVRDSPLRATAGYRKEVLRVLTERALKIALHRAMELV